ncbi:hypothetical protein AZI85_17445 [Bdellovibrio bacteriovorus]|uniref:Uncharacterized protein n=1 Tax=Bdellovibrio bacteriovorus TaxID=959 RepID=A0A150WKM9_BDEBC|nr:hypothetical protein [Bdellovibrio bacteriovorus]KYG64163.1 hypothetical protein AZI85_17445 [Bdellovibrio bacteriovorus]
MHKYFVVPILTSALLMFNLSFADITTPDGKRHFSIIKGKRQLTEKHLTVANIVVGKDTIDLVFKKLGRANGVEDRGSGKSYCYKMPTGESVEFLITPDDKRVVYSASVSIEPNHPKCKKLQASISKDSYSKFVLGTDKKKLIKEFGDPSFESKQYFGYQWQIDIKTKECTEGITENLYFQTNEKGLLTKVTINTQNIGCRRIHEFPRPPQPTPEEETWYEQELPPSFKEESENLKKPIK